MAMPVGAAVACGFASTAMSARMRKTIARHQASGGQFSQHIIDLGGTSLNNVPS